MNKPGPEPRDSAEQARVEAALRDVNERQIAFNAHLGLHIQRFVDDKRVEVRVDMRPELVGHYLYGRLHGGVISSVLDATGGMAVMWAIAAFHAHENTETILERFASLGTVDLRVDYLRPGIGEHFIARAEVVRLGRRIAATRMSLCNESAIEIATGNAAYIVS